MKKGQRLLETGRNHREERLDQQIERNRKQTIVWHLKVFIYISCGARCSREVQEQIQCTLS